MKKTLTALLSLVSMALLTSCNPDDVEKTDDIKAISLNASSEITVTEQNASENLLEVSWTDNSVYTEAVTYAITFSLKGDETKKHDVPSATSPYKCTGAAVQAILGEWNVAEETQVSVNVTVNAVKDGKIVNSGEAEVKVTVKSPIKPLALTINPLTVNLSEEAGAETAVTFSWTDENKYTGASYRLVLKAGGKSETIENEGEKTLSFTNADFNALVREKLALEASVTADVEAVVEAYSASGILASSASVYFSVIPFGKMTEYSALAVMGTATEAGDDASKALAMTKGEGVFTWKGELQKGGSLRILVEPDGTKNVDCLIPASDKKEIVSGTLENITLDRRSDNPRKEYSWTVPAWGIWEITVNLADRTLQFDLKTKKYSNIGMVGPATPNGWDAVNPTLLSTTDKKVFTWEGPLKTGTMRFLNDPSSAGWEVDQYIATEKDKEVVPGESQRIVLAAVGGPRGDYMWKIVTPGTYKITIDIDEMTILYELTGSLITSFENIKMVGPASPGGWDSANMTPLTKEGNTWKWTGHLNNGELKFVCNQYGNDWGTSPLLAQTEGPGVSAAEGTEYSCNIGGDDWKWVIRNSGDYTIEIDMYGKIKWTINSLDVASENYPSLGLIGNAAPNGWNQSYENSTLLPDGNGNYTWTGELGADGLHIMCDVTKTDWSSPRFTAPYGGINAESGKALPIVWKQNDTNWNIPEAGTYTVTVNIRNMTITFVKK